MFFPVLYFGVKILPYLKTIQDTFSSEVKLDLQNADVVYLKIFLSIC